MIAEENLSMNKAADISLSANTVVSLIQVLMQQTVPMFNRYIKSASYQKRVLNEDDFTQIFVEQAQLLVRKENYPFNINSQYRDIHNLSKGFSDFYFYPNEEGISTASIFSVESKRLPAPEKAREKEYVMGNSKNGGIERYKIEKHGKGLASCGVLGFIESNTFEHWLLTVNSWIQTLTHSDTSWKKDELLIEAEKKDHYTYLKSIAHRLSSSDVSLHHLWIYVPKT
ncbi:MAG: hypothetical protein EOP00_19515 [Pedobacter sp.]|nr:MAG: hypothetical protein EOP00_19515 [Pedobacter sp.]